MDIKYETLHCDDAGLSCKVTIAAQVFFSEPKDIANFEKEIRKVIEKYDDGFTIVKTIKKVKNESI